MMWGENEFQPCYFCWCSCFVAELDKSSFSADFGGRLAAWPVFSARRSSTLARETDARLLPG